MGLVDKVKQRLISKYGSRKDTFEQHVNAPAVETTEQHQYVKNVQEVIVDEQHEIEVRQVIQPVVDEQVVDADIQERMRVPQYRELSHHFADVDVLKRRTNEDIMTDMGSHTVADDIIEEVSLEPIVQQRVFKHVVETVQPVIRRRIVKPHVVNELIPVFQKQVFYKHVSDMTQLKPITWQEYQKRYHGNSHVVTD